MQISKISLNKVKRQIFLFATFVALATFFLLFCNPVYSIKIGFWLPFISIFVAIFLIYPRISTPRLPRHKLIRLVLLLSVVVLFLVFIAFPWLFTQYSVLLGVAVPFSIISFLTVLALLRRISKLFVVFSILILSMISYSSLWFAPLSYANLFGGREIEKIASGVAANGSNTELIARSITSWTHYNITDAGEHGFGESYFGLFLIPKPPYTWRRSTNPSEIIFYKYGRCEEYANLFVGLTKSVGIRSRVVCDPGEDHVWAEVLIENRWVQADPSNSIFDDPGYYERENGMKKQISYVYAINEQGTHLDVTNEYTNTGRLTVLATKDNEPVEGATVIVNSKFLWQQNPEIYNGPHHVTEAKTANSGICIFDLGGNDYLIRAELNGFWNEENVTVRENDNTNFVELLLLPPSKAISENTPYIVGGVLIITVIGIVLVLYARRR